MSCSYECYLHTGLLRHLKRKPLCATPCAPPLCCHLPLQILHNIGHSIMIVSLLDLQQKGSMPEHCWTMIFIQAAITV